MPCAVWGAIQEACGCKKHIIFCMNEGGKTQPRLVDYAYIIMRDAFRAGTAQWNEHHSVAD
jgi:hypothetical protein